MAIPFLIVIELLVHFNIYYLHQFSTLIINSHIVLPPTPHSSHLPIRPTLALRSPLPSLLLPHPLPPHCLPPYYPSFLNSIMPLTPTNPTPIINSSPSMFEPDIDGPIERPTAEQIKADIKAAIRVLAQVSPSNLEVAKHNKKILDYLCGSDTL